MSALPPGAIGPPLSANATNFEPAASPAFFRPYRSIGGFVAQITISEDHTDSLTITQQPVETGAAITDHAFRNAASVAVAAGWAMDPGALSQLYGQLLQLQQSRQPITVYTGKRIYSNMLVAQLRIRTDNRFASTLLAQFILQEIIMVSTQVYQAPAAPAGTASPQNQSEPQSTAPVQAQGQKNLLPAPNYNGPFGTAQPSGEVFGPPAPPQQGGGFTDPNFGFSAPAGFGGPGATD